VIQIESIHIQEFRGIRDLTLAMNGSSFVVSGPNGSGKSGVVRRCATDETTPDVPARNSGDCFV
jgi:predicted ATP-dependent endonuclease of OLD family